MLFSKDILAEIPKDGVEEKDVLIEIPSNRVDQFCETLKADWPLSIHAYYFIKTMLQWKVKKPSIKCELLCVDPDDNLATFVGILESDAGKVCIVVYTLEPSNEQLEKALSDTRKIKWDSKPTFEAVLDKHAESVQNAACSRGKLPEIYVNSTLYYMSNTAAQNINLKIPDNVYVTDLSRADIDYMYSVWLYNDIYSKQEVIDAVTFNKGVGVYARNDGKLLSWMVHTHYGGLGNLQTRKGEEGKGYGKLVSQYLTHEISKTGYDIHVTVSKKNMTSRNLFASIGFQFISPIKYITVK